MLRAMLRSMFSGARFRHRPWRLFWPDLIDGSAPDSERDVPVPTDRPIYGIALSVPSAGVSADDGIVYRVNNVYWDQEFELQ